MNDLIKKRINIIATTRSEYCKNSGQREVIYDADGLVGALIATDYKEPKKIALQQLIPGREKKRQNGSRFKDNNDSMFTLTAQDQHGVVLIKNKKYQVRRLTPRESFRLQGFPDWAYERAKEIGISDAQLYKQAGNAVTVNVVRWIGERIGTNKS